MRDKEGCWQFIPIEDGAWGKALFVDIGGWSHETEFCWMVLSSM